MVAAQGTIVSQLQQHFEPTVRRVDGHDGDIRALQQQQQRLDDETRELRASINRLNERLALGEQQASAIDLSRLADFDRDAHPN
eukprot:233304-Pyramimonas_sp.AAC.1